MKPSSAAGGAERVIAVVDGEHHPAVVRDQLERIASEHDLCGVLFAGGEEKLGEDVLAHAREHYGREVTLPHDGPQAALRRLAGEVRPGVVVDVSGEPVLTAQERLELAAVALDLGLEYRAAGLRLTPPPREWVDRATPTVGVIGTGKRTGKTAVSAHLASLARADGRDPVVVSMGRGGPQEPRLIRAGKAPALSELIEIARRGDHAASDYLEDAVLTSVAAVGCRRCGEGPAGETYGSNVEEGVRLALSLDPGLVVIEGSGAALPPVEAHRTVCVTHAARAPVEALAHLGPYRLLRSDVVVLLGADELPDAALADLRRRLHRWCAQSVACRLEPRPAEPLRAGARTAVFTTAPEESAPGLRDQLERQGIAVELISTNLARRGALRRDMELAAHRDCGMFLTELKAAAIDVVAQGAAAVGAEVAFLRNVPVSLAGELSLDDELRRLAEAAVAEARSATAVGAVG